MSNFVSNSSNIIKDGKPNSKFKGIDINNIYKGASTSPPKISTGKNQHGLQVLGKISSVRRMPPPANLPSLKSENNISTENIASSESIETDSKNIVNSSTFLSESKGSRWANDSPPNPQLYGEAQIYPDVRPQPYEENCHLWSNITQNYRRTGVGGYMEDFPTLGTGESMKTNLHKKSWEETFYGAHGPNLRPQNLSNWKGGGGQNLPLDQVGREDFYGGVFAPPRAPFMMNFPPRFAMHGGFVPPMYPGMRPPSIPPTIRYHGMPPDMQPGPPGNHSNLRQVSVVKDTDLEIMDKLSDGGWARTTPELNFSEKLVFSDEDDNLDSGKNKQNMAGQKHGETFSYKKESFDQPSFEKQYSEVNDQLNKDGRLQKEFLMDKTQFSMEKRHQYYGDQIQPNMDRSLTRPTIRPGIDSIRGTIRPPIGPSFSPGRAHMGLGIGPYMSQNINANRVQMRPSLGVKPDRYPVPYSQDPFAKNMDPRYSNTDIQSRNDVKRDVFISQDDCNLQQCAEYPTGTYHSMDRDFMRYNYHEPNVYQNNLQGINITEKDSNVSNINVCNTEHDGMLHKEDWSSLKHIDTLRIEDKDRANMQRLDSDFEEDAWAHKRQQLQAHDTIVALEKAKIRREFDEKMMYSNSNAQPVLSKSLHTKSLDHEDTMNKNGSSTLNTFMHHGVPRRPSAYGGHAMRSTFDPRGGSQGPPLRVRSLMPGDITDRSNLRNNSQISDYEAEWRHQEEIQKPRPSMGRLWDADRKEQKFQNNITDLGKSRTFVESGKSQYSEGEFTDRRNKNNYHAESFSNPINKCNLSDLKQGYSDDLGYMKKGELTKIGNNGNRSNSDISEEGNYYFKRSGNGRETNETHYYNRSDKGEQFIEKWNKNIERYPRQDSARSWGDEVEHEDRILAEGNFKSGNQGGSKSEHWVKNKNLSHSPEIENLNSRIFNEVKIDENKKSKINDVSSTNSKISIENNRNEGADKKSDSRINSRYHDEKLNVSFNKSRAEEVKICDDKSEFYGGRSKDNGGRFDKNKTLDNVDKNLVDKDDKHKDEGRSAGKKTDFKNTGGPYGKGVAEKLSKEKWGNDGRRPYGGRNYGRQRMGIEKDNKNVASQEYKQENEMSKSKRDGKYVTMDVNRNNSMVQPLISSESIMNKDTPVEKKIPSLLDNQVFPTRSIQDLKSMNIPPPPRYINSGVNWNYMDDNMMGYPISMRLGPREFYRGGGGRARTNRPKGRPRKPAKNLEQGSTKSNIPEKNMSDTQNKIGDNKDGSKETTSSIPVDKKNNSQNSTVPKKSRDRRSKNRRGSRPPRNMENKNIFSSVNTTIAKEKSSPIVGDGNEDEVSKINISAQEKKSTTSSNSSRLPPRLRSNAEPARIVGSNPYDKRTRSTLSTSGSQNQNKESLDNKKKEDNCEIVPHNEEWETASEGSVEAQSSQKIGRTLNAGRISNELRRNYGANRPYRSGGHVSFNRTNNKIEALSPQKNKNLSKDAIAKDSKAQKVELGINKDTVAETASGIVMRVDAISYHHPKLISDALREMATRFSWNLTEAVSYDRKAKSGKRNKKDKVSKFSTRITNLKQSFDELNDLSSYTDQLYTKIYVDTMIHSTNDYDKAVALVSDKTDSGVDMNDHPTSNEISGSSSCRTSPQHVPLLLTQSSMDWSSCLDSSSDPQLKYYRSVSDDNGLSQRITNVRKVWTDELQSKDESIITQENSGSGFGNWLCSQGFNSSTWINDSATMGDLKSENIATTFSNINLIGSSIDVSTSINNSWINKCEPLKSSAPLDTITTIFSGLSLKDVSTTVTTFNNICLNDNSNNAINLQMKSTFTNCNIGSSTNQNVAEFSNNNTSSMNYYSGINDIAKIATSTIRNINNINHLSYSANSKPGCNENMNLTSTNNNICNNKDATRPSTNISNFVTINQSEHCGDKTNVSVSSDVIINDSSNATMNDQVIVTSSSNGSNNTTIYSITNTLYNSTDSFSSFQLCSTNGNEDLSNASINDSLL